MSLLYLTAQYGSMYSYLYFLKNVLTLTSYNLLKINIVEVMTIVLNKFIKKETYEKTFRFLLLHCNVI